MNPRLKQLIAKWLPLLQKAGCTNEVENAKFLTQVEKMTRPQ
jgi:hypothetical protein